MFLHVIAEERLVFLLLWYHGIKVMLHLRCHSWKRVGFGCRRHQTKRRSAGEKAPTEFANERPPLTPPVAVVSNQCTAAGLQRVGPSSVILSKSRQESTQPITFSITRQSGSDAKRRSKAPGAWLRGHFILQDSSESQNCGYLKSFLPCSTPSCPSSGLILGGSLVG